MFWQRARVQRLLTSGELAFDEDGEIALHLARHEAEARKLPLAPLHILYGLVENEQVAAAIRAAGGDVDAIETRIFRALEADRLIDKQERWRRVRAVVGWALHLADRGQHRPGPAELWGGLVAAAPETAAIVEVGGIRAADVLSRLIHGDAAAETSVGRGAVRVILVNDDVTPQQLVVHILETVFELPADEAATRMLEAHTRGSGTVAQYPAEIARRKVATAHDTARREGSPLLFRLETANQLP